MKLRYSLNVVSSAPDNTVNRWDLGSLSGLLIVANRVTQFNLHSNAKKLFPQKDVDLMNLYVGNLSYQTTETELRAAFEGYGEVSSVTIIKDKFTGQSRGFGFVEMASDEQAQAAIDGLDGSDLGGRNLKVNKAKPREDRRDDRGRGGHDRRRDRRRW